MGSKVESLVKEATDQKSKAAGEAAIACGQFCRQLTRLDRRGALRISWN
jgi:hypothetical protein